MGEKPEEKKADFEDLSIEEGLAELDSITEAMQDPSLPLEKAFALYEKGTALVAYVTKKVESVEAKVKVLQADGTTAPFGDADAGNETEAPSGSGKSNANGPYMDLPEGLDEFPFE